MGTHPDDAPLPGEVTKAEASAELERRRELALGMGGAERVAAHHARGRLTARERVELFVDEGSFVELGMLAHLRPARDRRARARRRAVTGVGLARRAQGRRDRQRRDRAGGLDRQAVGSSKQGQS